MGMCDSGYGDVFFLFTAIWYGCGMGMCMVVYISNP